MAHYALLDKDNVVIQVITGKDEDDTTHDWEHFYTLETGLQAKRTSYNTSAGVHKFGGVPYRKNYASIGYSYDPNLDAFIPPKPFPSWLLNEQTCLWEPPVPFPVQFPADGTPPTEDQRYIWDESTLNWIRA